MPAIRLRPPLLALIACLALAAPFATCHAGKTTAKANAAMPAATPAEIAGNVRAMWAASEKKYLEEVKVLADQPDYADLVRQYTDASRKTRAALDRYLTLKLASPPTPPAELTPAVDELIKGLTALKTLQGQSTGPLAKILANIQKQQNEITQQALKNIR